MKIIQEKVDKYFLLQFNFEISGSIINIQLKARVYKQYLFLELSIMRTNVKTLEIWILKIGKYETESPALLLLLINIRRIRDWGTRPHTDGDTDTDTRCNQKTLGF